MELYNGDYENEDNNTDNQEREPTPLKEAIRRRTSTSRKSPGPDDVAAELLKFGGEMTVTKLHEISTEVRMTGQ